MELRRFQKFIEAINTYYAFALLLYGAALYFLSHSQLFVWGILTLTPLLAGWSGYLAYAWLERRNSRFGLSVIADAMTYEIGKQRKYTLRYHTKLKARTDHVMVYPVGHRWSGQGKEEMPVVHSDGQQLLAVVEQSRHATDATTIAPYTLSMATGGDWRYWFIALNPPVQRGETFSVKYSQTFHDEAGTAKPQLNYFVRTPMDQLELSVKFPKHDMPDVVRGCYFTPWDSRRPYESDSVVFDPDKGWATWTIRRPKRGYCYRIYW
jgi:hypothetical protein